MSNLIPDVVIEAIDHHEVAEDGKTLIVSCTLVDGRTLYATFCPGERPSISMQPAEVY